jgi:hypothetical protein
MSTFFSIFVVFFDSFYETLSPAGLCRIIYPDKITKFVTINGARQRLRRWR